MDSRPLLIITARTSSKRLPNKVLLPIYNSFSILEFIIHRMKTRYQTSRIVVATSDKKCDDKIQKICNENNIKVVRGPEDNVIKRMKLCLDNEDGVRYIGRITADNPLTDPELVIEQINAMKNTKADYCYCHDSPIGTSVDLWTRESFEETFLNSKTQQEKEHVNVWTRNSKQQKKLNFVPKDSMILKNTSLTIDTREQYEDIKNIINDQNNPIDTTLEDFIRYLETKQNEL